MSSKNAYDANNNEEIEHSESESQIKEYNTNNNESAGEISYYSDDYSGDSSSADSQNLDTLNLEKQTYSQDVQFKSKDALDENRGLRMFGSELNLGKNSQIYFAKLKLSKW